MNAKEFLIQARAADIHIDEKLDEIEVLYAKATKMTTTLSDMKVQTSSENKFEAAVLELDEAIDDLKAQVANFRCLKAQVDRVVNQIMQPDQIEILYGVYYNGQTLTEVAHKIDKTVQHTSILHQKALENVSRILKSKEK